MTFSSVLRSVAGAAMVGVGLAFGWVLWADFIGSAPTASAIDEPNASVVVAQQTKPSRLAAAYGKLAVAMRGYARQAASSDAYPSLLDPHALSGAVGSFSMSVGIGAEERLGAPAVGRFAVAVERKISSTINGAERLAKKAADRVAEEITTASLPVRAPQNRATALAVDPGAPVEKPSVFERLFGKPSPTALAYASTDDGGLDEAHVDRGGRFDRMTAVYDISSHTVYMPDGTKLEAHSGRGIFLDDPRHADERNRGVTPPNVYDLVLRESPFHGVRAIRLIPVDEDKVFGRSGFLAHTYMLGPNGASLGCVSFKNYNAFLQAYLDRRIKRLAVVAGPV